MLYPYRLYLSSGYATIVFLPYKTAAAFKKAWFTARNKDSVLEGFLFWQNRRKPAVACFAATEVIAFDESPQDAPLSLEEHSVVQSQESTRTANKKAVNKVYKVKEAVAKKTAPKRKF